MEQGRGSCGDRWNEQIIRSCLPSRSSHPRPAVTTHLQAPACHHSSSRVVQAPRSCYYLGELGAGAAIWNLILVFGCHQIVEKEEKKLLFKPSKPEIYTKRAKGRRSLRHSSKSREIGQHFGSVHESKGKAREMHACLVGTNDDGEEQILFWHNLIWVRFKSETRKEEGEMWRGILGKYMHRVKDIS
jgi:hypothetical protein